MTNFRTAWRCRALVTAAFLFVFAPAAVRAQSGAVWGDSIATPSHGPTAAPTAMETLCAVPDRWNGGIQLYAMTPNGIEMQAFDATFWGWRSWENYGNQTGWPVVGYYSSSHWDPMLTGLSWNDTRSYAPRVAPRVNLFHEFTVIGYSGLPALWLGEPWRVQPPGMPLDYNYTYDFTPPAGYYPKTTFGQSGGQINVFGTEKAAHHPYLPASSIDRNIFGPPAQNLVERFWSGSGWSYTQHGSPDGYGSEILVGPCSSAWVGTGRIAGAVGLIEDHGNGVQPVARLWDTNYGAWGWLFFNSPSTSYGHDYVHAYRSPLLVAYPKSDGWYIRFFVVGLFNSSGVRSDTQWRLYSIEMHPDGHWYDDQGHIGTWNDHGPAPNVTSNRNDVNGNPFGFDMTARAIWNDGSHTRVNLIRHTDLGDQITEFYFNGNTWQWGGTPHLSPNPNYRLYCDTACVANRGVANQRISVFAHLSDGEIWERRYDLRLGGGWTWERRQ